VRVSSSLRSSAAAERYLTDSPLSIGEIAYLLGIPSRPPSIERSGGGTKTPRRRSGSVNDADRIHVNPDRNLHLINEGEI
jgi:hypothetical protein